MEAIVSRLEESDWFHPEWMMKLSQAALSQDEDRTLGQKVYAYAPWLKCYDGPVETNERHKNPCIGHGFTLLGDGLILPDLSRGSIAQASVHECDHPNVKHAPWGRPWKIIFAFIPPTDYCGGTLSCESMLSKAACFTSPAKTKAHSSACF